MKVKGSLYWIYSFTSGCKGKMLVAILLAVIGVLCGMAPYFALAGILSGLIQNTLTAERIFCYVGIAVLGETLKMLFNTVYPLWNSGRMNFLFVGQSELPVPTLFF